MKFTTPDASDKRIHYASLRLEQDGLMRVERTENADFVLLGVNPDKTLLNHTIPVFAGNIRADNVFDYTKNEGFALQNAYLTAESALALAIQESDGSLINASVLITGYGRIAKALQELLTPLTKRITICARNREALTLAACRGAETVPLRQLAAHLNKDYIFNTIPHPVFNAPEITAMKKDTLLMDLASFPGGVDRHMAKAKGIRLLEARGLPAKYAPLAAGNAVAAAVEEMMKEVFH